MSTSMRGGQECPPHQRTVLKVSILRLLRIPLLAEAFEKTLNPPTAAGCAGWRAAEAYGDDIQEGDGHFVVGLLAADDALGGIKGVAVVGGGVVVGEFH